jgi:type II secretory pathway component GspD/PulD (secretin)
MRRFQLPRLSKSSIIIYVLAIWLFVPVQSALANEPMLINNIFADTYITEALQDLAFQAGVSILTDNTVSGFITLELVDVPFEEALDRMVSPGGYIWREINGVYYVGSVDPRSPLFHTLSVSEAIKLNHITAAQAKALIGDFYYLHARFDTTSNTAFITSSPTIVARFKQDVALIDRPPTQLLIDVLVTEVSKDVRDTLGVDMSLSLGGVATGPNAYLEILSQPGTLEAGLRIGGALLQSQITALASEGKVKVRANPQLMVVDGKSADIFVGRDSYVRLSNATSTSLARLDTIASGVSLRIEPRVAADGTITLLVEPKVSDLSGTTGDDLPVITRRQVSTTVRAKDGETIVLGGLIQEAEYHSSQGLSILSNLPIFRNLFKRTNSSVTETEILVFLTPHIMEP